eukprot:1149763-Pelagomonas_calceolata.AAC.8
MDFMVMGTIWRQKRNTDTHTGDLEAAIPLLLEKRYDELHFLLRHAAPSTSLHYAEHAPSATPPHTSLAAPALREPQAPRSSSARASTEAPHVDSEGTMRLPHGAPHCPAHPPAGACVGSEGARDEGRRNGVNGVVRNVGAMGHDLDAVEEERRPARARGRAVSASGSAAGSTAATEMDVRAHLENEHLRLKKLVFFLQRGEDVGPRCCCRGGACQHTHRLVLLGLGLHIYVPIHSCSLAPMLQAVELAGISSFVSNL